MSSSEPEQSSAEISEEMLAEWSVIYSPLDSDEHRPYRGGRRFHGRHRHGHANGRAENVLEASTITHPLAEDRTKAGPRVLSLLQRETAVPVPTVFDTCD